MKFNQNNVYVGFKTKPADLANIVVGATLFGNRAYGFGVHVWAFPASNPDWEAGDPYHCEATGRYGKINNNSCE